MLLMKCLTHQDQATNSSVFLVDAADITNSLNHAAILQPHFACFLFNTHYRGCYMRLDLPKNHPDWHKN